MGMTGVANDLHQNRMIVNTSIAGIHFLHAKRTEKISLIVMFTTISLDFKFMASWIQNTRHYCVILHS